MNEEELQAMRNLASAVIHQAVDDILCTEEEAGVNKWLAPSEQAWAQATARGFLRVDNENFQWWCSILDMEAFTFLKKLQDRTGLRFLSTEEEIAYVARHRN